MHHRRRSPSHYSPTFLGYLRPMTWFFLSDSTSTGLLMENGAIPRLILTYRIDVPSNDFQWQIIWTNSSTYLECLNSLPGSLVTTFHCICVLQRFHVRRCFSHVPRSVCDILHTRFPHRWIRSERPVHWPARSPNMNLLNFFVWGCMK